MNEKEIRELRRRMRPQKNNITRIYGCYVTDSGEIISKFSQSVGMMPENEQEKYLALLKRAMSGGLGRNLIDISFRTQQVVDSPEHKLLMSLRDTELKDEALLDQYFEKVVASVSLGENYLILVACDNYDVPFKGKDNLTQDRSDETFRYIISCVCPVKLSKSALRYMAQEQEFHDKDAGWVVSAPELGFVFPAFDGRRTNIYNALYYSHDLKQSYDDFVAAVFNTEIPLPAAEQKKTFEAILSNALEDTCSYEVVQNVHEQLSDMIEIHKESREEEPLVITQTDVRRVLEDCHVPEENLAKFTTRFDEEFGTDAVVSPKNLIDAKKFEVRTPDVVIKVNPERSDLIQTRVIGGIKYIMINADEEVEVNGVSVHIAE